MQNLRIYVNSPQRYARNGRAYWEYMEKTAALYGFTVANSYDTMMPSSPSYKALSRDLLDDCDIVIGDVNLFRGGEPESAVVFDLGMGYAKKKRLYSYTLDRRNIIFRYPQAWFDEKGELVDASGWHFNTANTIGNLMYSIPSKVVGGGFEEVLKTLEMDLIEERKDRGQRVAPKVDKRDVCTWPTDGKMRAYLAGYECFFQNVEETGKRMEELCRKYGFEGIYPPDEAPGLGDLEEELKKDPYAFEAWIFDRDQQHIRNSNMIQANFGAYHGIEPDSGTVFETGMGYALGYPCYVFTEDGRPMIERVHCFRGEDGVYRDVQGYAVEDFGLPLPKIFSEGCKIWIGDFEEATRKTAIDIGTFKGGAS